MPTDQRICRISRLTARNVPCKMKGEHIIRRRLSRRLSLTLTEVCGFFFSLSSVSLPLQAQFGTLSDYFNAVYKANGVAQGSRPADYPVLSGDFFAYADREDHYWTGYFTSRPFYKSLDRVIESHLR